MGRGIVVPLAKELAKRMKTNYSIIGPCGLGCCVVVRLLDDPKKRSYEQESWGITLRPGNLDEGELRFETGIATNEYVPGSIGAINGMNQETETLPQDIEKVMTLLRHYTPNALKV